MVERHYSSLISMAEADFSEVSRGLRHSVTRITSLQGLGGITRWAMELDVGVAWVSWKWEEAVMPRTLASPQTVFSVANPMNVASNILLTDPASRPLLRSRRVLVIYGLVSQLPWQDYVREVVWNQSANRGPQLPLAAVGKQHGSRGRHVEQQCGSPAAAGREQIIRAH